jgi:hypothetical protein
MNSSPVSFYKIALGAVVLTFMAELPSGGYSSTCGIKG